MSFFDSDSEDTDSEDTDSEDTDSEDTDSEDTDSEGWALPLLLGGAALAILYLVSPGGGLSAVRKRALELVSQVVPSKYGDARFSLMAPHYYPGDPSLPKGFSTCGYLPGYVGKGLGIDTRYGLSSIRDLGKSNGSWKTPKEGLRPKAGDFYLLGSSSGAVLHAGVIISANGSEWETADAGQGSQGEQSAAYLSRVWDGSFLGGRLLLGWLDIEKAPR